MTLRVLWPWAAGLLALNSGYLGWWMLVKGSETGIFPAPLLGSWIGLCAISAVTLGTRAWLDAVSRNGWALLAHRARSRARVAVDRTAAGLVLQLAVTALPWCGAGLLHWLLGPGIHLVGHWIWFPFDPAFLLVGPVVSLAVAPLQPAIGSVLSRTDGPLWLRIVWLAPLFGLLLVAQERGTSWWQPLMIGGGGLSICLFLLLTTLRARTKSEAGPTGLAAWIPRILTGYLLGVAAVVLLVLLLQTVTQPAAPRHAFGYELDWTGTAVQPDPSKPRIATEGKRWRTHHEVQAWPMPWSWTVGAVPVSPRSLRAAASSHLLIDRDSASLLHVAKTRGQGEIARWSIESMNRLPAEVGSARLRLSGFAQGRVARGFEAPGGAFGLVSRPREHAERVDLICFSTDAGAKATSAGRTELQGHVQGFEPIFLLQDAQGPRLVDAAESDLLREIQLPRFPSLPSGAAWGYELTTVFTADRSPVAALLAAGPDDPAWRLGFESAATSSAEWTRLAPLPAVATPWPLKLPNLVFPSLMVTTGEAGAEPGWLARIFAGLLFAGLGGLAARRRSAHPLAAALACGLVGIGLLVVLMLEGPLNRLGSADRRAAGRTIRTPAGAPA